MSGGVVSGPGMSWITLIAIAGGAYAFKVLGLVILGGRALPAKLGRCLDLLPAALLPALIAVNTVATGQHLGIDARIAGVTAASIATWRRAAFPLVVVLGAAVTAAVRHWS